MSSKTFVIDSFYYKFLAFSLRRDREDSSIMISRNEISHLISLPTLKPMAEFFALHKYSNRFPRKIISSNLCLESLKEFFDTFVMFILKEFPEEISVGMKAKALKCSRLLLVLPRGGP